MVEAPEDPWPRLRAAFASGETIWGTVIEVKRGGLILDVGARAFLPATLFDDGDNIAWLDCKVGERLPLKIIELSEASGNLVVSRRAALCGSSE